MRKFCTLVLLLMSFALTVGLSVGAQSQPAPLVDRVGFPDNYQTEFVPMAAFDRPDNRQVRVIYGNHLVTNTRRCRSHAPGSAPVVREVVRERFEQQLTEAILGAQGLKGSREWRAIKAISWTSTGD
jgi:hypothetical protein